MRAYEQTMAALILAGVVSCVEQPAAPRPPRPQRRTSITTAANARIAYESDRDGVFAIYIINPDGSGQTRLTNNTGEFQPAWSPDGSRIAFVGTQNGENGEIYVMNSDGSNQMRIINDPGALGEPTWSPDGTRIAFVSHRDGDSEIYAINADGSGGLTRLTDAPESQDYSPDWGPDGRIAFASTRGGTSPDIYVMNSGGSGVTAITHGQNATGAKWSPDGSKILFISYRLLPGSSEPSQNIYVVNSDGTQITQLPEDIALEHSEDWSPDGARIVYSKAEGGQSHLFIMNRDGTASARVTSDDANERSAAWEPIYPAPVNHPPALNPGGPYSGFEGTRISFTATAGDLDGDVLSYSWNFGDGTSGTGDAFPTAHSYADNGTYLATFSVSDGHGGSDTRSVSVSAENLPPVVRAPPDRTIISGTTLNFAGGFTDPGV